MTHQLLDRTDDATDSPPPTGLHDAARQRMLNLEAGGMFRSDWLDAVFIHYEVDPHSLQACTPFELDLFDGRAFATLVAFHMRRFRIRGSGPIGAMLLAPGARHGLLNVRTYVRHENMTGICFLTEWIPNPLSVFLGPRLFGLPYRFGRLCYRHESSAARLSGTVETRDRRHRLRYAVQIDPERTAQSAPRGSVDEFLLERYTAFMDAGGNRRFFRIWHQPWQLVRAVPIVHENGLIGLTAPWLIDAELVGAHYSPGVRDVWIGRPRR